MKILFVMLLSLMSLPIFAQDLPFHVRTQWRQDFTIYTTETAEGTAAIDANIMNTKLGAFIRNLKMKINRPEILAALQKLDAKTGKKSFFIIDARKFEGMEIEYSEISLSLIVDSDAIDRIRIFDEDLRHYRNYPVDYYAETLKTIQAQM